LLTKRHIEILKLLLAQPDGDGKEIVCDGRSCAIGLERISRGTVNRLLAHMAVKDSGYSSGGVDIYIPTENTQQIIDRPALADEMVARVYARKPFFVTTDGVIRDA
jgi:hypothetical protein